jgi:hypothetical protein
MSQTVSLVEIRKHNILISMKLPMGKPPPARPALLPRAGRRQRLESFGRPRLLYRESRECNQIVCHECHREVMKKNFCFEVCGEMPEEKCHRKGKATSLCIIFVNCSMK